MSCVSFAPKTLDELRRVLDEIPENYVVLGGGTDLVIRMRERFLEPEAILYPGGIPELKAIRESDDAVELGAAVTMTEAGNSALIRQRLTALFHAVRGVGSMQIRNKATLAGNVATASPAGDLLPVMFLYGALAEIFGPSGERRLAPVESLVSGKGKTGLKKRELITRLIIPKPGGKRYRSAFHKLGSRHTVTISRIGMAVSAVFDENRRVGEARVFMGAISPVPMHVPEAEEIMRGRILDCEVKDRISALLFRKIEEITPKGYERHDARYYERHYRYYKPYAVRAVVEDTLELLEGLI